MGCACDQERSKEDVEQKISLARVMELSKAATRGGPKHRKLRTDVGPKQSIIEVIRVSSEPLTSIYRLNAVVREDSKSRLLQAEFLSTKQACLLKCIQKLDGRELLLQKAKLSAESERLGKLDHPFVLRTYETFQDNTHFYVAMEPFNCDASVLLSETLIRDENFLAKFMYQVFRALNYIHQSGFIHGRLSLRSIMLQERPVHEHIRVKLSGFGEFCSMPGSDLDSDAKDFQAPEIDLGHNEKCDMWSCGMILSKLLAEATVKAQMSPQKRKSTPAQVPLWSERSEEISALLSSLLHRNPQGRPTAAQCLRHPWIQKNIRPSLVKAGTVNSALANLRTMRPRNPLHEGILKFILTRAFHQKDFEPFIEPFFMLDQDLDGVFTEEEVRSNFLRVMADTEALKATKRVMEASEHNCGCVVPFSEFLVACLGEKKILCDSYLREAFRCFDRERNGHLSLLDLRSYFLQKSEKEKQWRLLFLQAEAREELDFPQFSALLHPSK